MLEIPWDNFVLRTSEKINRFPVLQRRPGPGWPLVRYHFDFFETEWDFYGFFIFFIMIQLNCTKQNDLMILHPMQCQSIIFRTMTRHIQHHPRLPAPVSLSSQRPRTQGLDHDVLLNGCSFNFAPGMRIFGSFVHTFVMWPENIPSLSWLI